MAKRKPKPKPRPFDPSGPSFKTQPQFRKAVKRRARAQVQPLLQDVSQRRTEAASANRAREADIERYFGYGTQTAQDAFGKINTALNGLITGNAGLSGASQAALAAALRGSAATEAQQASVLGAAPTVNPEAAISAGAAMGDVGTLGTLGNLEAIRGRSAQDIGLSGVAHREAGMGEERRFADVNKGLTKERSDIRARIPGIREEVRQQMMNEEMQKASQRFQEGLAGKEFRLKKRGQRFQENLAARQQRETERSNRANETLNMAQIQQAQQQMQAEIDAAADDGQKEQLTARAERFNQGIELIQGWIKPTDQEKGKGGRMGATKTKAYQERLTHGYQEMVQQLVASTGMGQIEARRVILAAVDRTSDWGKRWASRSQREIHRIKLNRKRKQEGVAGPPSPLE